MEHQPVCKDDRQRCRKGQVAERHVRVAGFDGHSDKIQAAGAGVLHINQRIPHAADHTAADGGQHAVPLVHRQRSQHIVRKNGKQHHAPHAAEKEILAQVLEADQHNGDVHNNVGHTNGQTKQAEQNGTDTGHTGYRHPGRHSKAVQAKGRNKTADDLQRQVFPAGIRHILSPASAACAGIFVGAAGIICRPSCGGKQTFRPSASGSVPGCSAAGG